MTAPVTALQWNCRSFQHQRTTLLMKVKQSQPSFILLQETHGTPSIPGYVAHTNPSITQLTRGRSKVKSTLTPGYAAVLVQSHFATSPVILPEFSSCNHEVIAVLTRLPSGRKIILVSAYYKPIDSSSRSSEFAWIPALVTRHPNIPILICGDFNAPHPQWGYSRPSARGSSLADTMDLHNFILINEPFQKTRIGLHKAQEDTTPDLTWATPNLIKSWSPYSTTWGSDHFPLLITFRG